MKKYTPKTVYCPQCHRKVSVWDGRSSTDVIADCRKFRKRVIYRINTGKTEIKNIPPRNCSSGITFW